MKTVSVFLICSVLLAIVPTTDGQIFQRFRQRQQCINGNCNTVTTTRYRSVPFTTLQPTQATAAPFTVEPVYAPPAAIQPVALPVVQQEYEPLVSETALGRSDFHKGILKAVAKNRREGKITNRQALAIRVRMFSPAFREHVKTVAVTQLAFSGDENAPVNEMGVIDEAAIDWDGFAAFLERIIPIILQLISAFGG